MLTERKEVMWCVDCGARFTQEEIKGWGCPKCGSQGVPCGVGEDTTVEINWHELRILVIWAENWAQHCKRQASDDSSGKMPKTVTAIARRLEAQRPTFGPLGIMMHDDRQSAPAPRSRGRARAGIHRTISGKARPAHRARPGPGDKPCTPD